MSYELVYTSIHSSINIQYNTIRHRYFKLCLQLVTFIAIIVGVCKLFFFKLRLIIFGTKSFY